MKLSSRKQLMKESDIELNKIRLRILLESYGKMEAEKIEKAAQIIADKKTEQIQSSIEKDLAELKRQSISMQRAFEKANKETGVSIEDWYKSQPFREKIRYAQERYEHREISDDNLWDRIYMYLSTLAASISYYQDISKDSEGNYFQISTGKKISPPAGLDPVTSSGIRAIVQSLTL